MELTPQGFRGKAVKQAKTKLNSNDNNNKTFYPDQCSQPEYIHNKTSKILHAIHNKSSRCKTSMEYSPQDLSPQSVDLAADAKIDAPRKSLLQVYKQQHRIKYSPKTYNVNSVFDEPPYNQPTQMRCLYMSKFFPSCHGKRRSPKVNHKSAQKQQKNDQTIEQATQKTFIRRKSLQNRWITDGGPCYLLQGQERVRLSFLNSIVKGQQKDDDKSRKQNMDSLLRIVKLRDRIKTKRSINKDHVVDTVQTRLRFITEYQDKQFRPYDLDSQKLYTGAQIKLEVRPVTAVKSIKIKSREGWRKYSQLSARQEQQSRSLSVSKTRQESRNGRRTGSMRKKTIVNNLFSPWIVNNHETEDSSF